MSNDSSETLLHLHNRVILSRHIASPRLLFLSRRNIASKVHENEEGSSLLTSSTPIFDSFVLWFEKKDPSFIYQLDFFFLPVIKDFHITVYLKWQCWLRLRFTFLFPLFSHFLFFFYFKGKKRAAWHKGPFSHPHINILSRVLEFGWLDFLEGGRSSFSTLYLSLSLPCPLLFFSNLLMTLAPPPLGCTWSPHFFFDSCKYYMFCRKWRVALFMFCCFWFLVSTMVIPVSCFFFFLVPRNGRRNTVVCTIADLLSFYRAWKKCSYARYYYHMTIIIGIVIIIKEIRSHFTS